MKRIVVLVRIICPIISLISAVFGTLLVTISEAQYLRINLFRLHYNYGIVEEELYAPQSHDILLKAFHILLILCLVCIFLPILSSIFKLFKWNEGEKAKWKHTLLLVNIISIILLLYSAATGYGFSPTERSQFPNETEYAKYRISWELNLLKNKDNPISYYSGLSLKVYFPVDSPYKKYLPSMALEEQKALIKELDKWWKENKNYCIWDSESSTFKIDKESKVAGIWTQEFPKAPPWPQEENKK